MPIHITASSEAEADRKAKAAVDREIKAAWASAGNAKTASEMLRKFERELKRRLR